MAKFRPEKRKSPCAECPFRRKSVRGYLGADRPQHFLEMTMRDADMPCHMDIDYSDPEWLGTQQPDAPLCVGAMQFQNNNMKLSRDPDIAEAQRAVGENPNVFSTPEEFLIHHQYGPHATPVLSSLWWRATDVNVRLGFQDTARVEHWRTADMEDGGLWVGYDLNGEIIHCIEDTGQSFRDVEWLKAYYVGSGQLHWLADVDPAEYRQYATIARGRQA